MANLTVKEVAQELGVSEASIYNLCSTRQLPHLRIGTGRGVIRIPVEAVTAYIVSCTINRQQIATQTGKVRNHDSRSAPCARRHR